MVRVGKAMEIGGSSSARTEPFEPFAPSAFGRMALRREKRYRAKVRLLFMQH
jgi:hypothetical protein